MGILGRLEHQSSMNSNLENHWTVESRSSTYPKLQFVGLMLWASGASCLLILTILGSFQPHILGKIVTDLLPFGWLIGFYMLLSTGSSPSQLNANHEGIQVQIWWWRVFLYWSDIEAVKANSYQMYIYSRKLPPISSITGVLLFRFRPLFVVHWRRENYTAIQDILRENLPSRYEKV
ncbi:MAG: hypothetical protein K8J31_23335 [Anaerolineae bacterium]|nr:hypothetical protein [Anaerolineae bacterium]